MGLTFFRVDKYFFFASRIFFLFFEMAAFSIWPSK